MARSSTFHPMQFEMKSMDPKQLFETRSFLEQSFLSTHIRYPLNIEKSEEFLTNEKILLIGNEGRTDPGFLCFLPRKPVQFLKCRLDTGFYLRLRVESSLYTEGTVFIASSHLNVLTVQDCWMWQGENLTKYPYSKRFSYVTKFLTSFIIQDPRLSGFEVQAATHFSLESFPELVASQDYASIDFIPENSRRRRLFYRLDIGPQKSTPKPLHSQIQIQRPGKPANTLVNKPYEKTYTGPLIAFAKNIQGLPDTFDLFGNDKVHIGEAAIQEEEISMLLSRQIQKTPSLLVTVEWNGFLDAFEIKGIAPPGSKVLPSHLFMKYSQKTPQAAVQSQSEFEGSEDSDV
jgi:hypothetical protein